MDGYTGKILVIDLTTSSAEEMVLDDRTAVSFLGGRGLGVHLARHYLPDANVDPLSPANPLIFATGPFTGFPIPGASRTSVVTKSPATRPRNAVKNGSGLSIGQMAGHFAIELKYAGWDALVLLGRCADPTILVIHNDTIDLKPAHDLWGQEIPEAELHVRSNLPQEPYQAVMIGPTGEKMVPMATIVHSHPYSTHAGRGGSGAVMGAKNLKGIFVRGSRQPFDVADHQTFDALSYEASKALEGWNQFETWRTFGTAALIEAGNDASLLAVSNFREGSTHTVRSVGAVRASDHAWVRSEACFYCALHCKKISRVLGADGAGIAVAGPELETSVMLGTNCGVTELNGLLLVKDRCDRLGIDPSSFGNTMGFLMEANQKGLVDTLHLEGVDLKWGDWRAMLALAGKVATGKGIGAHIGRGVRHLSGELGGGSAAWAMEVKGLEMDTYNVPALAPMVIVYGTNSMGGIHEMGHSVNVQNARAVSDSLGLCRFHTYANRTDMQAKLLGSITGREWTEAQLLEVGERIWNLERVLMVREGFTAQDDRLPARPKTEPFTSGPKSGAVLAEADEERMLAEYYAARGWDPRTGAPTPATLKRLALNALGETSQHEG